MGLGYRGGLGIRGRRIVVRIRVGVQVWGYRLGLGVEGCGWG